jgi:hypothetical protein
VSSRPEKTTALRTKPNSLRVFIIDVVRQTRLGRLKICFLEKPVAAQASREESGRVEFETAEITQFLKLFTYMV